VPVGKSCTRARPHTFKGKSVKRRIWCEAHQRHYNKDQKHADDHVLGPDNICRLKEGCCGADSRSPPSQQANAWGTPKPPPLPSAAPDVLPPRPEMDGLPCIPADGSCHNADPASATDCQWDLKNYMPNPTSDLDQVSTCGAFTGKRGRNGLRSASPDSSSSSSGSDANPQHPSHPNDSPNCDWSDDAPENAVGFSPANSSVDGSVGILSLPSPRFSPMSSPMFESESELDSFLDSTSSFCNVRRDSLVDISNALGPQLIFSGEERATKKIKVEDDSSVLWVKLKFKGVSAAAVWTCLGFNTSATTSRMFQELMDMLDSGMISLKKLQGLVRSHVLMAQKGHKKGSLMMQHAAVMADHLDLDINKLMIADKPRSPSPDEELKDSKSNTNEEQMKMEDAKIVLERRRGSFSLEGLDDVNAEGFGLFEQKHLLKDDANADHGGMALNADEAAKLVPAPLKTFLNEDTSVICRIVDDGVLLTHFNRRAEEMFGISGDQVKDELLSDLLNTLVSKDDVEEFFTWSTRSLLQPEESVEGSHILQCMTANKEHAVCLVRSRVFLHDDTERNLFAMVITFSPLPQMSKYLVPQRSRPAALPPSQPFVPTQEHPAHQHMYTNTAQPHHTDPSPSSVPIEALAFQTQPDGISDDVTLY